MQQQNRIEGLERSLTTPRAAGVAGVLFALLFGASTVMIRLAFPSGLLDHVTWTGRQVSLVTWAATLVPFAGIAFLWFLGVLRDRLGSLEDKFFASVFYGSGLLFVAMIFAASALAAGIVGSLEIVSGSAEGAHVLTFGRVLMYQFMNIYAIRMAGVCMISLSTVWLRTGVMPRPAALVTLAIALVLLLVISFSLWIVLVFPAWVLSISLYILYLNLRQHRGSQSNGLGPSET